MSGMFANCQSLRTAPDLSGLTTVPESGLYSMFSTCTSLTEAPNLIKITDVDNYGMQNMFYGCTYLTTVYAPTITWDTSKTQGWLDGVAASGTLYADASIASTIPTNSTSDCPNGWTVASI